MGLITEWSILIEFLGIVFLTTVALLFVILIWLLLTNERIENTLSQEERYFKNAAEQSVPFPALFVENPKDTVYLSIIIPAYNEEKRLDIMMEETTKYVLAREKRDPNFKWEIIIVSDGSRDKTPLVAFNWVKKFKTKDIRILDLKKNRGKGGAVKRGMMIGRGKYMLMVDADGATKFSDLDRVERELRKIETKDGHGIAIGSRAHLQGIAEAKRSFFRNLLMWGFHLVVSWIGGIHSIRDTQCGFKLFSRNTALTLFSNLHLSRWAFDVELLWLAQQLSIPIAEVSVTWKEIPGSHLEEEDTRLVSIRMFKDLLRVRMSYSLRLWKVPYHAKQKLLAMKSEKAIKS